MEPLYTIFSGLLFGTQGYCESTVKKFIVLYLSCLLQEKQNYPESKKILNYEMSLVYRKSLGWSSIKMQHIRASIKIKQNDHQFKMKSCITTLSKFNFALVMTKYDMEKPFFLHCSKRI